MAQDANTIEFTDVTEEQDRTMGHHVNSHRDNVSQQ